MLKTRPPWQGPDFKPKDLDMAEKAFRYGFNPNDPELPPNYLKYFDEFGVTKKKARFTTSDKALVEYGLVSSDRKTKHRAHNVSKSVSIKKG